eukprot:TRINITY_DN1794_c0_g1_i7.p2 TRINITY_DN1794_c0_g1~~TRINITY_DN1794_c0_g1_i7.p2  ORF type:complete len:1033 (-),score=388.76 TRINITY_DN1794_c0_g1_i7:125-3223(-)
MSQLSGKLSGDYVEVVRSIIQLIKQIKTKALTENELVDQDILSCVKSYNQFVSLMKPSIVPEEAKSRTLWAEFSTAASKSQETASKIAKLRAKMDQLRMNYVSLKSEEEYESFGAKDTEFLAGETNLFKEMKQLKSTSRVQKDQLEFTGNQLAAFIKKWVIQKSQEVSESYNKEINNNNNTNSSANQNESKLNGSENTNGKVSGSSSPRGMNAGSSASGSNSAANSFNNSISTSNSSSSFTDNSNQNRLKTSNSASSLNSSSSTPSKTINKIVIPPVLLDKTLSNGSLERKKPPSPSSLSSNKSPSFTSFNKEVDRTPPSPSSQKNNSQDGNYNSMSKESPQWSRANNANLGTQTVKPKEKDFSRGAQTLKGPEFGAQRAATLRNDDTTKRNRSATQSEHIPVAPPVSTIGAALDAARGASATTPVRLESDTFVTKEKLSLFILVRPTRKELEDLKILQTEATDLPELDPSSSPKTTAVPDVFSPRHTFKTSNAMKNAEYEIRKMNFVKHFLKGEQCILLAAEIYYRDELKRNWTKGSLVLTTYRVVFVGDQMISIPLGFVNTCDPIKKKASKKTGSHQKKLEIETKDFRRLHFNFAKNNPCPRSHFASVIKNLLLQPPEKLFAFTWKETFPNSDGWKLYNAEEEFIRMGIKPSNNNGWKITLLNQKYTLCSTYPAVLAVPSRMTDKEIEQVSAYRSRGRIQTLSWIHPKNNATITRCSQPRTGLMGKRSVEDEKMIVEILNANKNNSVLQIFDARPSANAKAQQFMGAGTENMSHYPNCVLTFHNIDNIHVMRESLKNLSDAVNSEDDSQFLTNIDNSGWLKHTSRILLSAAKMVDVINNKKGSVLVHCSDGWDRTPQMTGLAMILLDPYYRTTVGFEVLIEKEFLSYGHQFALRTGHDGAGRLGERSPVFLQFMDCVYQLSQQFPNALQFNETLLRVLVEESFACRFGTFLFDCDREREKARVKETTQSVWSFINSDIKRYTNVLYKPTTEVLVPSHNLKKIKFWEGYHFKHMPEFFDNKWTKNFLKRLA